MDYSVFFLVDLFDDNVLIKQRIKPPRKIWYPQPLYLNIINDFVKLTPEVGIISTKLIQTDDEVTEFLNYLQLIIDQLKNVHNTINERQHFPLKNDALVTPDLIAKLSHFQVQNLLNSLINVRRGFQLFQALQPDEKDDFCTENPKIAGRQQFSTQPQQVLPQPVLQEAECRQDRRLRNRLSEQAGVAKNVLTKDKSVEVSEKAEFERRRRELVGQKFAEKYGTPEKKAQKSESQEIKGENQTNQSRPTSDEGNDLAAQADEVYRHCRRNERISAAEVNEIADSLLQQSRFKFCTTADINAIRQKCAELELESLQKVDERATQKQLPKHLTEDLIDRNIGGYIKTMYFPAQEGYQAQVRQRQKQERLEAVQDQLNCLLQRHDIVFGGLAETIKRIKCKKYNKKLGEIFLKYFSVKAQSPNKDSEAVKLVKQLVLAKEQIVQMLNNFPDHAKQLEFVEEYQALLNSLADQIIQV